MTPFLPHFTRVALLTLLTAIAAMLAWPTLSIWGSWLYGNADSADTLGQMAATVLPRYAWTSLQVGVGVAIGTASLGVAAAVLVVMTDFPGRRWLEWALLLPLAMPGYVVAYVYTDFLQFSGPLQEGLRQSLGLEGRLWPDIRSVWGAILVLSLTLYPYVYLLVRAALVERAASLVEAARVMGASLWRRIATIAVPMARPALVAGVALALMETLADFGVASYFGIQTFTTGIYKSWLVMDDRWAAAQLATLLLLVVMVLLAAEKWQRRRMRFHTGRTDRHAGARMRHRLRGPAAWGALTLAGLPLLLGFGLPVALLFRLWWQAPPVANVERFAGWIANSVSLSVVAAVAATLIAVALSFLRRDRGGGLAQGLTQVIGLGYAVPGVVVVVGVLLPLEWMRQAGAPDAAMSWVTATSAGLLWAYLVRFSSVALQSVDAGYARIPRAMDEVSRTLGVAQWALFRRLHVPMLGRSVAVAALLVFVDVMKELPVTLVLRPFNSDTLAVVAYQLARDERLGEAALPSVMLVLVGLLPVLLLSRTLKDPAVKSSEPL